MKKGNKKIEKKDSAKEIEPEEMPVTDDEIKDEMEIIVAECGETYDAKLTKFHSSNLARVEKMYKKGTLGKCALPLLPIELQRKYVQKLKAEKAEKENHPEI